MTATDAAQALADIINAAATLARYQTFTDLDADKVSDATIERHIALARELKAAHDVLARVVAGRPDQPTHTTPLFEGEYRGAERRNGKWVAEIATSINLMNDDHLDATRVTVYATDPHTPNQGDTP